MNSSLSNVARNFNQEYYDFFNESSDSEKVFSNLFEKIFSECDDPKFPLIKLNKSGSLVFTHQVFVIVRFLSDPAQEESAVTAFCEYNYNHRVIKAYEKAIEIFKSKTPTPIILTGFLFDGDSIFNQLEIPKEILKKFIFPFTIPTVETLWKCREKYKT